MSLLIENINDHQLLEVFDSQKNKYPVVNLNPKDTVPQLFLVKSPGNDNLVVRLVSGKSVEEQVKKLTVSDKVMHVYIMSLSASGNEVKLKGGLGDDPLGAITSIFDVVMSTAKTLKLQAILFRFTRSQMKGKEKVVQRILDRLINARSGGKYAALEEIQSMGKKYAYVLAKAKSVPSDEVKGLSKPNESEFKVTDTAVGKVYISDKTGEQVSKDYAVCKSVSDEAEKTSPQTVLRKTRISRRTLLDAQFRDYTWYGKTSEDFEAMLDTPPVYSTSDIPETKVALDISERVGLIDTGGLKEDIYKQFKDPSLQVGDIQTAIESFVYSYTNSDSYSMNALIKILGRESKTTAQLLMDANKALAIADIRNEIVSGKIPTQDGIKKAFILTNDILNEDTKSSARGAIIRLFVNDNASDLMRQIQLYSPRQYSQAEQSAIRIYTGFTHKSINNAFLAGNYDKVDVYLQNVINDLDSAFKNGERLKKDTILYRGQRISTNILNKAIENKIFYFGNFVSTSLKANIYTGEYGDFSQDYINNDTNEPVTQVKELDKSYVAWVISKAYRTKVIIPGGLSEHPHEVEVILPRGTALKMNAMAGDMEEGRYIIESEVVEPSLIESDQEIYDGDALLKEGIVKRLDFKSFKESLNEAVTFEDNQMILQDLLDYLDVNSEK